MSDLGIDTGPPDGLMGRRPARKGSGRRRAGIFTACAPLVLAALVCLPHCGERPTSRVAYLGAGDVGQGSPVLTIDRTTFMELLDEAAMGAERYIEARDAMLADGRAFRVAPRTKVRIVLETSGPTQVEVLEGGRAGAVGWTAASWVRPE
jgi:hypothetical protein